MASFQPSLKHFILRQEVIHLYRHTLRASKGILPPFPLFSLSDPVLLVLKDPVTRRETLAWIRSEFERNKHITEIVRVYHALLKCSQICVSLSLKTRYVQGGVSFAASSPLSDSRSPNLPCVVSTASVTLL